jgi:hypothetical protein
MYNSKMKRIIATIVALFLVFSMIMSIAIMAIN